MQAVQERAAATSEVDQARVDAIRASIANGSFTVDANKVASAMLGSLAPVLAEQIDQAAADAEAAIERCQNLNQGNAQVLQRLKQKADAIKTVISGGEGQRLYGDKGKTSASGGGRALGEA
ncbi:flagellar biosynthesis anti-sigma factor FlgM [Litorivicinus lipolyticus]|uniref:Negative regulator of flagellin synthesis n=2 Tax=Litorivicinus lipolyticus TaxID=418701 RepID=A0A5Q2QE99_9GAMM|nr:flagellar biosynthesis anti-sigma factor FlgM [Litorivicinus lipolyticus]